MIKHPSFMSPPTYRNYDYYKCGEAYAEGWNDAMRFIFGQELQNEADRIQNEEAERLRASFKVITGKERQ